jgi:asparagine synthase (glutamine-hydrolysing)
MTIGHPFLDPRLICFCLGLPVEVKSVPGQRKAVLAEAMRGVLPEHIRCRRRKGHFNEVYFLGLARNLPTLQAMVQETPLDELDVFDKDTLLECLNLAALGVGGEVAGLDRLNLTLSAIRWLSLQAQWRGAPLPPVQVLRYPRDIGTHAPAVPSAMEFVS